MVTLDVTVTDSRGLCVTGVDRTRFEVYDDKVRQDITFFGDDDIPLTVGIVFDASGSMGTKLVAARRALAAMLERSHQDDDIFAIGVSDGVSVLQDFTPNAPSVANAFLLSSARGRTALLDGVYASVNKCHEGRNSRRAVVVISDGQDNWSRYTLGELEDLVKEADVTIYAVGIVDLERDQQLAYEGVDTLQKIAEATGGRAYFPVTEAGLFDACCSIALRLRHRYSLGYYPSNATRDGAWHDVRVKLSNAQGAPRLAAVCRGGYFAPSR